MNGCPMHALLDFERFRDGTHPSVVAGQPALGGVAGAAEIGRERGEILEGDG